MMYRAMIAVVAIFGLIGLVLIPAWWGWIGPRVMLPFVLAVEIGVFAIAVAALILGNRESRDADQTLQPPVFDSKWRSIFDTKRKPLGKLQASKKAVEPEPGVKSPGENTTDSDPPASKQASVSEARQVELWDPLTGLPNHRGMLERLNSECETSRLYDLPLSLALVEVEPFWMLSRDLGIEGAEKTMERIADLLLQHAEKTDVVTRYGPEQFCVIMSQTELEEAGRRLETFRKAIEEDTDPARKLQAAIGAADRSGDKPPADLLEAAYHALERSRRSLDAGGEKNRAKQREEEQETKSLDATAVAQTYNKVVDAWSRLVDLKDPEPAGHTQRVVSLMTSLAHQVGMKGHEIVFARWGAQLHDVGKIAIPDSILQKPGSLTEEEWLLMQQHPMIAYEMLSQVPFLAPALDIPYCHHEKWDGTGYPRGLEGEEIPWSARLFAVIDVYDALCTDRPYRQAWETRKVLAYLQQQSGAHFDPRAVAAFVQMIMMRVAA